jgi:hypothetical protein
MAWVYLTCHLLSVFTGQYDVRAMLSELIVFDCGVRLLTLILVWLLIYLQGCLPSHYLTGLTDGDSNAVFPYCWDGN